LNSLDRPVILISSSEEPISSWKRGQVTPKVFYRG
jgi:hypothetical protein